MTAIRPQRSLKILCWRLMKPWRRIISGRRLPFVYRTHEVPDTEKIKKLSTFINNFGYNIHMGSDEVHPKELQKLLGKDRGYAGGGADLAG